MTETDFGDPQIINPTSDESKYCRIVFNVSQQGIPSSYIRLFNPNFKGYFERQGVGTYDIETRIINSTFTYKEYWWGTPSPPPPPISYAGRISISEEWASKAYGGGAAGTRYMEGSVREIRNSLNYYWGANHLNLLSWDVKYRYNIIYSSCPNTIPPSTPTPVSAPIFVIYSGTAAPPPLPPKKKMDCCDCNTIASIIADQIASQFNLFESIKDHIDLRTKEEIQIYREQLEALEIDLQPILDRLNEVERNLWNGIPK